MAPGGQRPPADATGDNRAQAITIADQDYVGLLAPLPPPSISLMVKAGLWIELYAAIGFLVGLGLASLMGQRTVPVILLIVLEIVLTPLLSQRTSPIWSTCSGAWWVWPPATSNRAISLRLRRSAQRADRRRVVPESATVAVCVIVGWIVVWTALGAWRMVTRDA